MPQEPSTAFIGAVIRCWCWKQAVLLPSAWQVAFSEAIYDGQSEIEGVTCLKVSDFAEAKAVLEAGAIPMMMDETCEILKEVRPWALVECDPGKKEPRNEPEYGG